MRLPTMEGGNPLYSASLRSFRLVLIGVLSLALLGVETVPALAQATAPTATPTPDPAAVEAQVKKFGVGKSVKIRLVSGELLNGHIRTIGTDSFTVKISRKSQKDIPYNQVADIKDPSPLVWIIIGAVAVIVIILIAHH